MLVGLEGRKRDILSFQRAFIAKQKAFTLIELLIASSVLLILVAAAVKIFQAGESIFPVMTAKIDFQAKIRSIGDLIARDVRQAYLVDIANNSPSASCIKFRTVNGVDTDTGDYLLTADYIEYDYDDALGKITRNVVDSSNNIIESREFRGITGPPFYTIDTAGVKTTVDFKDNLNGSKRMVIAIIGRSQVRGRDLLPITLEQGVKIRNE